MHINRIILNYRNKNKINRKLFFSRRSYSNETHYNNLCKRTSINEMHFIFKPNLYGMPILHKHYIIISLFSRVRTRPDKCTRIKNTFQLCWKRLQMEWRHEITRIWNRKYFLFRFNDNNTLFLSGLSHTGFTLSLRLYLWQFS